MRAEGTHRIVRYRGGMMIDCAHLEEILVERSSPLGGCEDWSDCCVDDVMFLLERPA